jgi:hypothetical protein
LVVMKTSERGTPELATPAPTTVVSKSRERWERSLEWETVISGAPGGLIWGHLGLRRRERG